jgi:Na+-driven multidrug efflux pump
VLLGVLATPIARVFSDAPAVIESTRAYLTLVPFSFGLFGIAALAGSVFNALGRPLRATVIVVVRLAVLALPLAWLGARVHGLPGLFAGIAAANILVGLLGWWMVGRGIARAEAEVAPQHAARR